LPVLAKEKSHIPYVLFLFLSSALVSLGLFGDGYPISIDHPTRFAISHFIGENLLPQGQLDGLNPEFHAGMPASTFYPPLGFALPGLLRALLLNAIDWVLAYKLAVLLSFFLITCSVYLLAAELGLGKTSGLFAAFFFSLLDYGFPGNAWEAGGAFVQVYTWGMWNNSLGIALSIFSIVAFLHFSGKKKIVYTSLLLALSMLANPWPPFWGFLAIAVLAAFEFARKHDGKILWQLSLIAILVAAFSSFWLLPLLQNSEYHGLYSGLVEKAGYGGRAFSEIMDGLLSGKVIGQSILWLSACGAILSFRIRKSAAAFLLVMAVLSFIWMLDLHLLDGIPFLDQIQNFRFLAYLRVILAILAGVAAASILKMAAFAKIPFLAPAVLAGALLLSLSAIPAIELSPQCPDLADAYNWLSSQPGNYRIAYFGSQCSWHGFDASPVFAGKPSLGTSSAFSFYSRPSPITGRELGMWNAKYAVAVKGSSEDNLLRRDNEFIPEAAFGNIAIYSNRDYAPSYLESSDCTIDSEQGAGSEFSAKVQCGGQGIVVFKFSYYPNWKAQSDGKPVAVERELGPNRIWVSLPAGAHDLRFYYERPLIERLLFAVCLAAMAGAFIAAKFNLMEGKKSR